MASSGEHHGPQTSALSIPAIGVWSLLLIVVRVHLTRLVAPLSFCYIALEEGIPITDPSFYSSPERCPKSLIEHVFRRSDQSTEDVPMLAERIAVMREVGAILAQTRFRGSFLGFIQEFQRRHRHQGTALDL